MLVTASTRTDIAGYVNAVFEVYLIILLVYVLTNLMFALGVRPPYSRFNMKGRIRAATCMTQATCGKSRLQSRLPPASPRERLSPVVLAEPPFAGCPHSVLVAEQTG